MFSETRNVKKIMLRKKLDPSKFVFEKKKSTSEFSS